MYISKNICVRQSLRKVKILYFYLLTNPSIYVYHMFHTSILYTYYVQFSFLECENIYNDKANILISLRTVIIPTELMVVLLPLERCSRWGNVHTSVDVFASFLFVNILLLKCFILFLLSMTITFSIFPLRPILWYSYCDFFLPLWIFGMSMSAFSVEYKVHQINTFIFVMYDVCCYSVSTKYKW